MITTSLEIAERVTVSAIDLDAVCQPGQIELIASESIVSKAPMDTHAAMGEAINEA